MKRRDFIKALGGGLAVSTALPFLPIPAPPTPQGLMFHKDAFSLVMKDFDVAQASRMDVIYGWGSIRPPHSCVVADDQPSESLWRPS